MDAQTLKEKMRAIWEESLGVAVQDSADYFDIGGHSFLAMQIITRIESLLEIRLPFRIIFDHPEFGDFADAVGRELEVIS